MPFAFQPHQKIAASLRPERPALLEISGSIRSEKPKAIAGYCRFDPNEQAAGRTGGLSLMLLRQGQTLPRALAKMQISVIAAAAQM